MQVCRHWALPLLLEMGSFLASFFYPYSFDLTVS